MDCTGRPGDDVEGIRRPSVSIGIRDVYLHIAGFYLGAQYTAVCGRIEVMVTGSGILFLRIPCT